jgi:type IV pilus assembly protein PilV
MNKKGYRLLEDARPGANRRKLQHQGGFSLVEVLVSILVLSLGVLGMVGMQAAALQSNREARLQSTGVFMARELADMMRGNRQVSGDITNTNPYLGSFSSSPLTYGANSDYCMAVASSTLCTSGIDVAQSQMTEWLARLDAELPGARVDICREAAPFDANGLPVWSGTCTVTGSNPVYIKIGWTRGSTNKAATGDATQVRATVPSVVVPVVVAL